MLESSVPVGTTRRLLGRLAEQTGVDVAFAPERIDPGNARFPLARVPRLVGGLTPRATERAAALYRRFVDQVVTVASPEVAEMSKLVENAFRLVNVSLVNEVAQICDAAGVDVWAVLEAAGTKPYGYLPHWPGPGVGGHCIPVVPRFLAQVADEVGRPSRLIAAALDVNGDMPRYVAERVLAELAGRACRLARRGCWRWG